MLETEYLKSMNLNYERIKLNGKPEERRYQYCILSRGGIRGLLDCSLRFINGDAFLYYDITSKQSISKMFYNKKTVDRDWVKDFVWNLNRIQQEASRFLLDDKSIIWFPEQVYRDIEDSRWSFIYYPYYDGENGFRQFLEFVIEKLDYDDELLVECVYRMYEQYEEMGDIYIKDKIFRDVQVLDEIQTVRNEGAERKDRETGEDADDIELPQQEVYEVKPETKQKTKKRKSNEKRGLLSFLEGAKRKDKADRERIKQENLYAMEYGRELSLVAEEPASYDDEQEDDGDYGRTVYLENVAEAAETKRRLYDEEGMVLAVLDDTPLVIGKKKEDADVVIDNRMVSRIHARVFKEDGEYMIEDLNSTNGTFKNGLRLKPYEKRRLMEGDEIRLGSVNILFR